MLITTHILNVCRDQSKAVSFHANYRKGTQLKIKDLKDHGYWIHENGKCQDFVPTI